MIAEYIEQNKKLKKLDIIGMIQHGSTVMGVSNDLSDLDIFVVVDGYHAKELVVDIFQHQKIHLQIINVHEFEKFVNTFVQQVLDAKHDLNLMSGRVISGKVLQDRDDTLKSILATAKNKIDFNILEKKFYYQFLNDLTDTKVADKYVRAMVVGNAVDSLGTMVLVKNRITTLNQKWLPLLLKDLLTDDEFQEYISLRFSSINIGENEINTRLKRLAVWLARKKVSGDTNE